MALDKTFASGEILSAANVNGHLLGLWIPIDKRVVASGSPVTSINFTSLDSNFRIFRLTYHLIATNGLWLRVNNDSGANYTQQTVLGNGGTAGAGRATSAIAVDLTQFNAADPAQGQWIISKLSTTAQARLTGGVTVGPHATLQTFHNSVSWNNTSSLLNQINILGAGGAGNFYGIAALEGMRGV